MKFLLRILFLFSAIVLSSNLVLANTSGIALADSIPQTEIDSTAVYYFVGSIDSLALGKLHHIDTILTKFHQYDPSFNNNNYYAGKGNIGQQSSKLNFDYTPIDGFNYSNSTTDLYSYKYSDIRYYQLIKPFTELYFVQGPEKEKIFEVTHTQNIMPRLNAGIRFRFITAPGIYEHQKTDNKNLYLTLRYRTENNRYGFILNYLSNKFETEENGGIAIDSLFEKNLETNRLLIPVKLLEAKNTEVQNSFSLNHYFNIGKPKTITKDSLNNVIERKGFSFGRLTHKMTFQKRKISFEDNMNSTDSTFFIPFDQKLNYKTTFDSTAVFKLENEFTWSNLDYDDDPENKTLYFYFGLKSQTIKISDAITLLDSLIVINTINGKEELVISDTLNIYKETYTQLIPKGGFSIYAFKSSRLNVDGSYVLNGYNSGNFMLKASLSQYLGSKENNWGELTLESTINKKTPDWFYTYHMGNNIRWENDDFVKENMLNLKAHYKFKGLYLAASYLLLDNYVYLDETAHPKQLTGSTSLISANLRYAIKLGKWSFDADLRYQKSNDNIISVPDFIGNSSLYFTNSIFGNVAVLQPGIEIFYNTAYYANAYMPAIRSFYTQRDEKIGNKIYADVFLNVKIKRTLFFLRYQHANSRFSKAYYMTSGYPMQDVALRFGISWKFYD